MSSTVAAWIAIGSAAVALAALAVAARLLARVLRRCGACGRRSVLGSGRQGRPRGLRRLAADPHRRPPPRRGRGGGRALADRQARRRLPLAHVDRALRRLRGRRRPPVGLARVPRRGALGRHRQRDPGARLRPHLRQGARPGPRVRSRSRRRSRRRSTARWPRSRRATEDMYRKAEIRPFRETTSRCSSASHTSTAARTRDARGARARDRVRRRGRRRAAGYVACSSGPSSALRVDQLFVSPEHEARGRRRQLLEYAEGYAICQGAATLQVVVEAKNARPALLLPGEGSRPVGRRRRWSSFCRSR